MVDRTDIHAKHMTATEFAALPETAVPTQLINGVVVVSPSPEYIHQSISANIFIMLKSLISDGKVLYAPMDVHLDEANVVQPDVMWIQEGGKCKVVGKFLRGAPNLVVEILSPATAHYDKNEKFRLYERYGVGEYWIIDPTASTVAVWRLDDENFTAVGTFGAEDTFLSPLLNQDIDGKVVFAD